MQHSGMEFSERPASETHMTLMKRFPLLTQQMFIMYIFAVVRYS